MLPRSKRQSSAEGTPHNLLGSFASAWENALRSDWRHFEAQSFLDTVDEAIVRSCPGLAAHLGKPCCWRFIPSDNGEIKMFILTALSDDKLLKLRVRSGTKEQLLTAPGAALSPQVKEHTTGVHDSPSSHRPADAEVPSPSRSPSQARLQARAQALEADGEHTSEAMDHDEL